MIVASLPSTISPASRNSFAFTTAPVSRFLRLQPSGSEKFEIGFNGTLGLPSPKNATTSRARRTRYPASETAPLLVVPPQRHRHVVARFSDRKRRRRVGLELRVRPPDSSAAARSGARAINEHADIVGSSTLPDDALSHTFIVPAGGLITDLGDRERRAAAARAGQRPTRTDVGCQ
jgi:hypothetical protein